MRIITRLSQRSRKLLTSASAAAVTKYPGKTAKTCLGRAANRFPGRRVPSRCVTRYPGKAAARFKGKDVNKLRGKVALLLELFESCQYVPKHNYHAFPKKRFLVNAKDSIVELITALNMDLTQPTMMTR